MSYMTSSLAQADEGFLNLDMTVVFVVAKLSRIPVHSF